MAKALAFAVKFYPKAMKKSREEEGMLPKSGIFCVWVISHLQTKLV
jgi:hypothetical protein